MAQTNVQAFSGDVEITGDLGTDSNILMSSNVFIKGPGPTSNIVAIGIEAGYAPAVGGIDSVAIGTTAGRTGQRHSSVAIGHFAGWSDQSFMAVAVGREAGENSQGDYSIAVGRLAGENSQSASSIAVGREAGQDSQGLYATAFGMKAGENSQGSNSIAMGFEAGRTNQGHSSLGVGREAGRTNQGIASVGVGYYAGRTNQGIASVAVGYWAGLSNQGDSTVATGRQAGSTNQGTNSIAIGYKAGETSQSANSIILNATGSALNVTGSGFYVKSLQQSSTSSYNYLKYDPANGNIYEYTSDDRVKVDEKYITHSLRSVLKLKPQTYYKRVGINDDEPISGKESGFMAQDIYYDTPELKHLVMVPNTATPTPEKPPAPSDDPADDPDYSAWGPKPASYDALGLIPYIIKGIQEIVTELPRSKTTVSNTWGQNIAGLVVSADTNTHKTNTTPIVTLSNVYMDKQWYGVVSEHTPDSEDYDTLVDTKGDTRIWVTDVGGPLLSGDLLTTSNIAQGYTQKQVDDLLRSSTVAKVTQDCDFTTPTQVPVKRRKQELVNVTYYLNVTETEIDYSEYKTITSKYKSVSTRRIYRTEGDIATNYYLDETTLIDEMEYNITPENRRTIEKCNEIPQDVYDKLSEEEKSTYTLVDKTVYYRRGIGVSISPHPKHTEEEIRQELHDVLDENGQIVWEDTGETKPIYTLVDHGTYKAALVTCKLV